MTSRSVRVRPGRRRARVPTVLVALAMVVPYVRAADVTLTQDARLSAGIDTNPRFRAGAVSERARLTAFGSLGLGVEAPRRRTDLAVGARRVDVVDQPVVSGSTFDASLDHGVTGERLALDLGASYRDAFTAFTELNEFGEIEDDQRQRIVRLTGRLERALSRRWSGFVDAEGVASRIVNGEAGGFVDYDQLAVTVGSSFELTERLVTSAYVGASTFLTDNEDPAARVQDRNETRTVLAGIQGSYELSEWARLSGRLGGRVSDVEFVAPLVPGLPFLTLVERRDRGFLAALDTTIERERYRVLGGYERSVQPTAFGLLIEQDRITAAVDADLGERTELAVRMDARRVDNIQGVRSPINRDRVGFSVELVRQLARRWRVSARAEWIWQAFADDAPLATGDDPRDRLIAGLAVRYFVADVPLDG